MKSLEETLNFERHRAGVFKFISELFYLPQKDSLKSEGLLDSLSESLRQVCPDAVYYSDKLKSTLEDYSDQEMKVEYTRLFIGPFKTFAPPYGSIYLENGIIMGETTVEVIKLYQKAGLSISDNFKNLPDHIAVELEFMFYLILEEIKYIENNEYQMALEKIEIQQEFYMKFLNTWVLKLCGKIIEESENLFYIALAECLMSYTKKSLPEKETINLLKG